MSDEKVQGFDIRKLPIIVKESLNEWQLWRSERA